MKLTRRSRVAGAAVTGVLALTLAACGSDDPLAGRTATTPADTTGTPSESESGTAEVSALSGELAGAGASSQEAAMVAWIAEFQNAHPDVTIAYDPVGSGGGRTQFLEGGTAFAGTDSSLKDEEVDAANLRCEGGEVIEIPGYISPIAVIFQLDGIDSLNMSGETIAKIFNLDITNWNDPAIAAENPDVELPELAITTVNRSDGSGTTKNFTDYLAKGAPDVWTYEVGDDYPITGGQSAQGTSGVVQTVTDGTGTIGYADASRAGGLGTVALKVGDAYVPYSPEAAAAVVDASPRVEGTGDNRIQVKLDRTTTAAGAYPLVLISYEIACTTYADAAEADLVREFLSFVVSAEGQALAAANAGAAPLSPALTDEVTAILATIG